MESSKVATTTQVPYKLLVLLRGPIGAGKSTAARKIETWFANIVRILPNQRLWEGKVFHEKYGVALVEFFENKITAVSWQTICHGIHLNREIEAMDYLQGATPDKPRIVILDRSLEDVVLFTWMAAGTSDPNVDKDRLTDLQYMVFKDLYQLMGSWHSEAGLKVISIGFDVSKQSMIERIKSRAGEDSSRQSEAKVLVGEDSGNNLCMMWQTLMVYTVNMEREFGGIYSLLKSHQKLPDIAWYKINGNQPAVIVAEDIKKILKAEMKLSSISVEKELLTDLFTERDTSYQNIQRPPEILRKTDLLKYYSKGHRVTSH